MSEIRISETDIKGLFLIDSFFSSDDRGKFAKVFERELYGGFGINFSLSETFISSSMKNVIRGMHFQLTGPQAKLVTVLSGHAFDVAVDLRVGSPTYKKWVGVELTGDNHCALYIPRGFAHGFASMEDKTIMLYQCDGKYSKETDTGIVYNDPDLAIRWPIRDDDIVVSKRDKELPTFKQYSQKPMEV